MQDSEKRPTEIDSLIQATEPVTERADEKTSDKANGTTTATGTTQVTKKSKVISFRVTPEQYDQIYAQCVNAHGELVITVGELARQALLTQRIVKPIDIPLTRYRLAVAGEIAMAITELVQTIEYEMDTANDEVTLLDCCQILQSLENIQKTTHALLKPINEESYAEGGAE